MDKVLILDFGSQYTQLIARKIRELHVYSEIKPYSYNIEDINSFSPKAIILSGGPASSVSENPLLVNEEIFNMGIPILGICYGMQLITTINKGRVTQNSHSQYGTAEIEQTTSSQLFKNCQNILSVWMSHGDSVTTLPSGFKEIAQTKVSSGKSISAFENVEKRIWGVQFHPEVHHTSDGKTILDNFLNISKIKKDFRISSYLKSKISELQSIINKKNVICALSGGVDSSVTAKLLHEAIGNQLHCVFVNNGLLRKNETNEVLESYKAINLKVIYHDATELFLENLKGISDPEQKRKIIGKTFIEVFEKEKEKLGNISFLAQGTTYPDVIESVSFKGPSVTIKSHHNVGGLPEKMNLKLIEPLRELFKDEVRELGRELRIPDRIIMRHPFPGPGLAIRILGPVTIEAIKTLQLADFICREEIEKAAFYDRIWQLATIFIPVKTVGVMGDERSYENVVAIRAVESVDGMTADWVDIPKSILSRISNRIINEVQGINRVVYDISSKPPATIEWE